MKSSKAPFIVVLTISIMLFVTGWLAYTHFFQFAEPTVDRISFEVTTGTGAINTPLLFSIALFLIPVLTYFLWQLAPITALWRRSASILMVLLSISMGIFLRHEQVKTYFITIVRPAVLTNGKNQIDYPIDPVKFVYYILAGLLLGLIVSWLLLKETR